MRVRRRLGILVGALALAASVLGAAGPASAAPAYSGLELWGDQGDYITGGSSYSFGTGNTTFGMSGDSSFARLWLAGPGIGLDFRAPQGQVLTAGTTYTGAQRASFAAPDHPGLDVFGMGRGCNTVAGTFTVLEITTSGTDVVSFAATFEQHCEGAVPAAYGQVAYQAGAPIPAASVLTLTGPASALPSGSVHLSGSLTSTGGAIGGAALAVARTDASGTVELPGTTTSAGGAFGVDVALGTTDAVFRVSFAGDAAHRSATKTLQVRAVKATSVLALAARATAPRGVPMNVGGTLRSLGAPLGAATLAVRRTDLAGVRTFEVVTGPGGQFSFTDTPAVGGPVTFAVSWAGDAQRAATSATATTMVARASTVLSLKVSASTFSYRARATLTVHLGRSFNNRHVALYARPLAMGLKAPGTKVVSGRVNAAGNLVVAYRMTRRTVFTAVFAGDYRFAPASRSVSAQVLTSVSLAMTGHAGVSGGTYRYRQGTNVYFTSTVLPGRAGTCEAFTVQRYSGGRWVAAAAKACAALDSSSRVRMVFLSNAPAGMRYRVIARVGANTYSSGGSSVWRYFMYV